MRLATKAGAPSFAAASRRVGYSRRARTAFLLLTLGLWPLLHAQQPTSAQDSPPAAQPAASSLAQVSFSFDRKGVPVPTYRFIVNQDATGAYQGQEIPRSSGPAASTELPPQSFRSPITLSPATTARIFSLARQLKYFNIPCASKAKNIADTGTKILAYAGPDGSGSCTYNYTESKDVQALTDIFQGIAETMDEGRELDRLHRYDRLGLDAAMTFLAQEVSAGHALEVGTIAASLRSITADPDVMERVRTRAGALLAQIPAGDSPR